ncbi:MAG TPA: hypothetical protein VIK15_00325 [Candidatus Anoxymicrobiaceae bacterium]
MLSDQLVKIIEDRENQLAVNWFNDVMESPYTPHIKTFPRDEALSIALKVLDDLACWLRPDCERDIDKTYKRFGEQFYYKGFRMEEMMMLLVLIKRHIWLHLLAEGIMTTNIEVYQALDVNNKVVLYFDRAIYIGLVGFKKARSESMAAS